jgi:hypothetical protein
MRKAQGDEGAAGINILSIIITSVDESPFETISP